MTFLQNRKWMFAFSVLYFLILIYLLFFAFFRNGTTTHVNLIPFNSIGPLTVYTFKTGEDWWHWLVNVPGNILAFVPMAVPLNLLYPKISKRAFWLLVPAIPCLAELLQYLFQTGSCDIDDVILNVAGICLGFLFLKVLNRQPVS